MSGQIAVLRRAARGGELVRTRRAEDKEGGLEREGSTDPGGESYNTAALRLFVWRRHLGPQTVKHVGDDVRTTGR